MIRRETIPAYADDDGCFPILAFCLAVITVIVMAYVQRATNHRWQLEITKRGYGEYYLDAANNKQWRWKEDASKEEF